MLAEHEKFDKFGSSETHSLNYPSFGKQCWSVSPGLKDNASITSSYFAFSLLFRFLLDCSFVLFHRPVARFLIVYNFKL